MRSCISLLPFFFFFFSHPNTYHDARFVVVVVVVVEFQPFYVYKNCCCCCCYCYCIHIHMIYRHSIYELHEKIWGFSFIYIINYYYIYILYILNGFCFAQMHRTAPEFRASLQKERERDGARKKKKKKKKKE